MTPLAGRPDLVSSTWDDMGSGCERLGCAIAMLMRAVVDCLCDAELQHDLFNIKRSDEAE